MNGIDDREVERFFLRRRRIPMIVGTCDNCGVEILENEKRMEIPSDGMYCEECFSSWIYED